jgi:Uma2 family endonuclease
MVDIIRARMTAGEFLALPETMAIQELLDGEVYMALPPTVEHQSASMNIIALLLKMIPGGRLFHAPIGVYLDDANIPEPDVFWLSADHLGQIKARYIEGAPDLVVEIFSASTAKRDKDKEDKFHLYEKHGVREYWMVDPSNEYVEVYMLNEGLLVRRSVYEKTDSFTSSLFGEVLIPVADILV